MKFVRQNFFRTGVGFTFAVSATTAGWAHTDESADDAVTWASWSFEPGVVILLVLIAGLYARGLIRLRAATHAPAKLRREAYCFWSGWVLLVVALVSPLHPLGAELFSAHMTQHELLMVAAAPLLVLGRPELVSLWAFSRRNARAVLRWNHIIGAERLGSWLLQPLVAWCVHTLALWIWHVPMLFEATLDHEWVHALQHFSFLGSALVFWRAVFFGRQRRMGYGLAVAFLFATALQSGALGALITFSSRLLYPSYEITAPQWGLSGIEDQQLGGLIMWVPSGLSYVVAGLALFARWMGTAEPRSIPARSAS